MGWLHKYCEQIRRNNREFINLIFRRSEMADKKQLVVLDRNTGEVWEMGEYNSAKGGDMVPGNNGQNVQGSIGCAGDYPLTPLDPKDELHLVLKLGREVLDFVPEERRKDVVFFGMKPPPGCKEYVDDTGICPAFENMQYFPVIFLRPETPPGPKAPPTRFITIPGICDNAKMSEETYQSIRHQLGK